MKAQITVFISMCLSSFIILVVSLCVICIAYSDGVRTQGCLDLGINSCLGEYSRELKEEYDLYYIDASYLGKQPSVENIKDRLEWYINENLVTNLNKSKAPWNRLQIDNISVKRISAATAKGGVSLKHQAVEALNREGKQNRHDKEIANVLAQGNLDSLINEEDVLGQWDELMEIISGMPLPKRFNEEKKKYEEVELVNPADSIYGICHSDILYLALVDLSSISSAQISSDTLSSFSGVNEDSEFDTGGADDSEFIEYLLEYMGDYQSYKDNRALRLELEYILSGENNDYDNLCAAVKRIYNARLIDNFMLAINDGGLWAEARAIASSIEVCLLAPEFIEPVAKSLVYATAFIETASDISTIMKGGRVKLHKISSSMSVLKALAGGIYDTNDPEGINYSEYITAMLMLMDDRNRNYRAMDLMEMEIRKDTNNNMFSMGWCIERMEGELIYTDSLNKTHTLKRIYGYY